MIFFQISPFQKNLVGEGGYLNPPESVSLIHIAKHLGGYSVDSLYSSQTIVGHRVGTLYSLNKLEGNMM